MKEAAALMNVSPRLVYMAKKVCASGRADLVAEIEAGRMSINAALKIAYPAATKPKDMLPTLVRAWSRTDEATRQAFLEAIGVSA